MINTRAKKIINQFSVNKFIETGIFQGDTLFIVQDWFIERFGRLFNTGPWRQGIKGPVTIYEIDSNQEYINFVKTRVQEQINVEIYCSDSVEWLKNNLKYFHENDKLFLYLDAHSHGSPNPEPLNEELKAICDFISTKKGIQKAIISIDDWSIPGIQSDLYSLDHIRSSITGYAPHVYHCLDHNFHGKYCCFIFLGYSEKELEVLDHFNWLRKERV